MRKSYYKNISGFLFLFFYLLNSLSLISFSNNSNESIIYYLAKEKSESLSKSNIVPFIEKDFIGFKEFLGFF